MNLFRVIILTISVILAAFLQASAQMQNVPVPPAQQNQPQAKPTAKGPTPIPKLQQPNEDNTWWYLSLFVLGLGLAAAIAWWLNSRKKLSEQNADSSSNNKKKKQEHGLVDSEKELEWLRKNKDVIDKRRRKPKKRPQDILPNSKILESAGVNANIVVNVDVKNVQLANNKDLPIFGISELELSDPYQPLPLSNDDALLGAIEQVQDEYEEDEQVRDLSIRILTMFKNRNSVEALSQVALYDLSSSLRVKAIITLSEFDHESVFESILLACADPTREVRAAAARSLSKLTLNRADAWARIIESGEEWRIVSAARAAIESGFVDRSFDRLTHNDYKQAYEAFALLTLIIEAREFQPIEKVLSESQDDMVRCAILHVIRVNQTEAMVPFLNKLATVRNLKKDFSEYLDETVYQLGGSLVEA